MTPSPPPHLIIPSLKEIQIVFNNTYIACTRSAYLVWERTTSHPQYFIPESALFRPQVQIRLLEPDRSATTGTEQRVQDVEIMVGGKTTVGKRFVEGVLDGHLRLEFGEMVRQTDSSAPKTDAWLEDGALTRLSPKNPSRSIDTALVSRHVVVEVAGTVVADSFNAVLLFETGLPLRYYLPAASIVDWGLLKGSERITACPYKGEARYFSIKVQDQLYEDLIWYYLYPIATCGAIAGRFCFNPSSKDVRVLVDDVEIIE